MIEKKYTELNGLNQCDVGKIALMGDIGDYVMALGESLQTAIDELNRLNNATTEEDMVTVDDIVDSPRNYGDLFAVKII